MELFEYREMRAEVIRTLRFERTREHDEANNYTHTHWDILIEVNWQPALMAYTRPGGPGAAPIFTPGTLPGATDLAILSRMLQPRGLLRLTGGGSVILETPALFSQTTGSGRYPCDVKGGPSVESVGVPQMIGIRHWIVTLHIVADTRDPTPGVLAEQNAVISNLWVGTETVDKLRRSVRRFAGRAILRADIMRHFSATANSFRDLYLFACPEHYQRENVTVQLSEDGTVCEWSFEDVMRGYDLGAGSMILDIECFRTGSAKRGSPVKMILDTVRNLSRITVGADLGIVAGLSSVASAVMENIPSTTQHVRCDVWGDRNSSLGRITAVAIGICLHQLGSDVGRFITGTSEVTIRQDVADQVYASVEMVSVFTSEAILTIPGLLATEFAPEFSSIGDRVQRAIVAAIPFAAPGQLGQLQPGFTFHNVANWRQIMERVSRTLDSGMSTMMTTFQQDQRRLINVEGRINGGGQPLNPPLPGEVLGPNIQHEIPGVFPLLPPAPDFPPPGNAGAAALPPAPAPAPVPNRVTVICSRQGDPGFLDNPPLAQGAFGVLPQASVGAIPGLAFPDGVPGLQAPGGLASGNPTGLIPAGREHLIVQALLGQNEQPPTASTLEDDS